jgi:hypothetical protein
MKSGMQQVEAWIVAELRSAGRGVKLKNLQLLDVLERDGDTLRLADAYQSRIKAHPNHPQNRGEKPYRVRLSQFLAGLQGGQA